MADTAFEAELKAFEGRTVGKPQVARDPVNQPMIRHWCDAIDDQNPVYTEPELAQQSIHGSIVAPPTMLQAWTMRGCDRRPSPRAATPTRPKMSLHCSTTPASRRWWRPIACRNTAATCIPATT